MLSCGFTPVMDVKVELMPDWVAVSLKHEEEEVPIETCSRPLHLCSTQSIKQEEANEITKEAVGEAACPKAPEILKAEATWEASEQKLEQIGPDTLIPTGPWLWKQQNGSQELMCRMCGQMVAACTLADVREHVLQCRSRALCCSVAQKGCYMDASKESLVLTEGTVDKPLLCTPTSSGISCNAGNSAPAEIEVSIDPEEQPTNSKHMQARGKVPKRSGPKKSKGTAAKRPRQPKEKGKKNPRPSTVQTYPCYQGQGRQNCLMLPPGHMKQVLGPLKACHQERRATFSYQQGECRGIKYAPINLAPAEIRVFTDGSFPKGFILRLYSRGKAEPSKNQKKRGLSVCVKHPPEKMQELEPSKNQKKRGLSVRVKHPAEKMRRLEPSKNQKRGLSVHVKHPSEKMGKQEPSKNQKRGLSVHVKHPSEKMGKQGMRTAYSCQVNLGFRVVCLHMKGYSCYSIAQALRQNTFTIQYILRYWKSHGIVPNHQRGKNLCPPPPLAHNQALHKNTQPKGRQKAPHGDLKPLHRGAGEKMMRYSDTKSPALAEKRTRSLSPSDTDIPTRKPEEALISHVGPLMVKTRASSHGNTGTSAHQGGGGGKRTFHNTSVAPRQQRKRQRNKIQRNCVPCRKFYSGWRKEYLMDYDTSTSQMVCMVCEKMLATVRLATITRHIQDCHSNTLNLPHQVRQTILKSWELRRPQLLTEPMDKNALPEKTGKKPCQLDKTLEKESLPELKHVSLEPSISPVLHRRYFQDHWRTRYLVEYDWHSDKMVCLVCGMSMGSMRICTIKRHAQRRHPSSLTFSTEKRQQLLKSWLRGDTRHIGQEKERNTAKQRTSM
ncbi:uncharacterized protein LOC115480439 isoform X3 [Microcaecilia unicolor]|uniref:Uncharacterized protein LOC115480439 isoform X3 n=1 Tax=Microcaecilia unicolor TaxID=1415580 RepID=A0A6P7Z6J5_9AMPH|nr:uncharacterized protein LOC115480439 isoform X3 [Microcaecilia unicolor]